MEWQHQMHYKKPNNWIRKIPRVYLLEGQDKFFTPEQFGGSKTEAKALFEESIKKQETFKPASSIYIRDGGFHRQSIFMSVVSNKMFFIAKIFRPEPGEFKCHDQ